MAPITIDMIRRRAEHNEGILFTLEELVLQEEGIEKIELLGQVCPHLKILYMPNNLIGKLENLRRLKELEYLNLALNNIVKVEGLEGCESLEKLDLTLNFVDKQTLHSLRSLTLNIHLKELFLTGNPCQDFHGYRNFVIATLPNLKRLDAQRVTNLERQKARKEYSTICDELQVENQNECDDSLSKENELKDEEVQVNEKGEKVRTYSPATRIAEHEELLEMRKQGQDTKVEEVKKSKRRKGFDPLPSEGRIYQKNEGGWKFKLHESDCKEMLILDLKVSKFLDTSFIDIDIQPNWIRILIKGKLLQLQLPDEVKMDNSIAQRCTITGNLAVTMPKIKSKTDAMTFITAKLENSQVTPKKQEEKKSVKVCSIKDVEKDQNMTLQEMETKASKRNICNEEELNCDDVPPLE